MGDLSGLRKQVGECLDNAYKRGYKDGKKDAEINACILQRTAEWVEAPNGVGEYFWQCSYCKFPSEAYSAPKLYKYCPNCGVRMENYDSN